MIKKGVMGISLFMTLFLFFVGGASSGEVIEEEVYLLVRERELMAFSAVGNRWVTKNLISGERVLESKYGGHVAVVFTKFRVLGFSALTNTWNEEKLMVDELLVAIEAKGNVGTAITNLRALGSLRHEMVEPWGRIFDVKAEKMLVGKGDTVFVRMYKGDVMMGDLFTIYSISDFIDHPVTGEKFGYIHFFKGILEIQQPQEDYLLPR